VKPPSTAREALITEAIGEVAALLDRVEALMPALDASREAAAEAGLQLAAGLEALEDRMAAVTETARTQVVQHIVQRTEEAAQRAQVTQSTAIAAAARDVFRVEVERSIQHLASAVQAANRRKPPAWEAWLTHAAIAVTASAATWVLMVGFWAR
jgi:hypothetical protein